MGRSSRKEVERKVQQGGGGLGGVQGVQGGGGVLVKTTSSCSAHDPANYQSSTTPILIPYYQI